MACGKCKMTYPTKVYKEAAAVAAGLPKRRSSLGE